MLSLKDLLTSVLLHYCWSRYSQEMMLAAPFAIVLIYLVPLQPM